MRVLPITKTLIWTALAAGLLAACTPQMEPNVTRFHAENEPRHGASFTILPKDSQKGGLEFQHYADVVAARLTQLDFKPLPDSGNADYVVTLEYGIGPKTADIYEGPAEFHGGWRGGPWGGGWHDSSTDVWMAWPHLLVVDIYDGPAWRQGLKISVFEARASGELSRPALPVAIPALTKAIFQNFPGNNGETLKLVIPLE